MQNVNVIFTSHVMLLYNLYNFTWLFITEVLKNNMSVLAGSPFVYMWTQASLIELYRNASIENMNWNGNRTGMEIDLSMVVHY